MILNLFPHLKGYKVLHGSPGYETKEVIKSIRTDRIKKGFLTLEFESGIFTFINKEDFDKFLEDGKVQYRRAAGFEAHESLIDLSNRPVDSLFHEPKTHIQRTGARQARQ